MKEQGALLNVDEAFIVVRTNSVLDFISLLLDKAKQKGSNWKEAIQAVLANSKVNSR